MCCSSVVRRLSASHKDLSSPLWFSVVCYSDEALGALATLGAAAGSWVVSLLNSTGGDGGAVCAYGGGGECIFPPGF